MSERISVVIPLYQGERFVAQTIETVLGQERRPEEVIVVDDGSTDAGGRIARSYPVTYVHQDNGGVAAARNAGLDAATGDFIALLDQDDLWEPRKLRLQLACLLERPELGWVSCRAIWRLEPGTPRPAFAQPEWFEEPQMAFITSAMLARRRAFEVVGGFDTRYVVASDSDWLVRSSDAGVQSATVEEVLVYRRLHDANNSYDQQLSSAEMFRILKGSLDRRRERGRAGGRARPSGS